MPSEASLEQAEALLKAARKSEDREAEAAALTDLGIIQTKLGRKAEAVATLESALALTIQSGNPTRGADVAGFLGTALLATGQIPRGLTMLEDAASRQASLGDGFAEKMTLERLAQGYGAVGDPAKALACLGRAIELSRVLGDG